MATFFKPHAMLVSGMALLFSTITPVMADNGYRGAAPPPPPGYGQPMQPRPYTGADMAMPGGRPGYGPGYGQGYGPGYGYAPGYHSGPRFRGPGGFGPWSSRGSGFRGPWNNRGNWGDFRNPFSHRSPGSWFNPNKGNMERNWDDMLNAPSRMGRMPGGWEAPSVSVPNPIDVGDQFSDAARDLPDQMDNFRYNNY